MLVLVLVHLLKGKPRLPARLMVGPRVHLPQEKPRLSLGAENCRPLWLVLALPVDLPQRELCAPLQLEQKLLLRPLLAAPVPVPPPVRHVA